MADTNIIELNGKRYNTLTGGIIRDIMGAAHRVPSHSASPDHPAKRIVVTNPHASKATLKLTASQPHTKRPARRLAGHKPQTARTLMRHTVKKPVASFKSRVRTQAPVGHSSSQLVKASTGLWQNPKRAHHIKVDRSAAISHFHRNASPTSNFVKRTASLQVKKPAATHHQPAKTSQVDSVLANGLARARSHEQKSGTSKQTTKRRGVRRLVNLGAASLAALLLIGFFAYQNLPNFGVRLASARAGIHASLPSHKPSGFALSSQVRYQPGTVTLSFHSNSDQRQFSFTQQRSYWDSNELLNSLLAKGATVAAVEAAGRTVYMYDHGSATWVSGGILYQISGQANLSSSQILDMATSI